jgi:hypothetical protein
MLRCYMDDSGTHEGSHNCLIAGYWGSVKQWRHFEALWRRALNHDGVAEFKANEFWQRPGGARIGPYRDWDEARHRRFIDRLLQAIETCNITPFAFGVLAEDWDKLLDEAKRLYSGNSTLRAKAKNIKAIYLSLYMAISRVVSYCKPGVAMHFIMDGDPRIASHALACFTDLKESAREDGIRDLAHSLSQLTFADSKIVVPLQAADLLAYEAHRYAKGPRTRDKNAPIREEYRRALRNAKTIEDLWLFDEARLRNLAAAIVQHAAGKLNG